LVEGYGIASDSANMMSKNLTQLAYDLSSLWNVDVQTAFQKLQSGMSGQIKGLKVWGINVSVAQLRETALAHGIDLATSKMTEAQKATLRYVTIMERTKNVQGDLARTIITPANSLRILQAQLEMTRRSLGNIVSVLVVDAIPYVQAFAIVVRTAANALASLMGYELPDIDYESTLPQDNFGDFSDEVDNATESVKKLKKETLGFDELNILSESDTSSALNNYDPTLGLDLSQYDYDFIGKGTSNEAQELADKWIENLEPLIPLFEGFANVFSGFWDAISGFSDTYLMPFLTGLGDWLKNNPETARKIGEIAGKITILALAIKGIKWLGEITGISRLVSWLWQLRSATGGVTTAFGQKNRSLEEQTKRTRTDLRACMDFVPVLSLAGAAALAFGQNLLKIPEKLPNLNPFPNGFQVPSLVPDLSVAFNEAKSWLSSQTWTVPALTLGGFGILTAIAQEFASAKQWLSSQQWSLPQIQMPDFSSWISSAAQMFVSFGEGIANVFGAIGNYLTSSEGQWVKWSLVVVGAIAAITVALVALNSQTGGTGGAAIGGMLSAGLAVSGAFASGGFPDEGEMFIAREAGPELVGSIGSRTAVANNNQIVDAVSSGVAKAVSSVMGGTQQTQQLGGSLKIKGSDLVYVVDKANRKKGTTISNNFNYGGR